MARSELEHGSRNAAIAFLMKSFGNFENNVLTVLENYFHYCALSMNCAELATCFAYLANGGVPLGGQEPVITPLQSRQINALMLTCGMYDGSGSLVYRIGMPGKSGSAAGSSVWCRASFLWWSGHRNWMIQGTLGRLRCL